MEKTIEEEDFQNFKIEETIPTSQHSVSSLQGISTEQSIASENYQRAEATKPIESVIQKRSSNKQKKTSLEEYRHCLLLAPKITDRKTVFISNALRERIVDIVRKLGYEKSSVSGFVENLVADHLEQYQVEIDTWKKL